MKSRSLVLASAGEIFLDSSWEFPRLVVSNLVVYYNFYAEALFCALLRTCVCALLRAFAPFRAHLHVSANGRVENDRVWELQKLRLLSEHGLNLSGMLRGMYRTFRTMFVFIPKIGLRRVGQLQNRKAPPNPENRRKIGKP